MASGKHQVGMLDHLQAIIMIPGQLVAGIRNGRITYLRLVLHAEGD